MLLKMALFTKPLPARKNLYIYIYILMKGYTIFLKEIIILQKEINLE